MRRRGPGPGPMAGRRMSVRMAMRRRRRRRRRRIILVGGLIALGSYKLSQKQVEQVEQHTGKTAEELTDEELERIADLHEKGILTDETYAAKKKGC